ncbi:unnamed protein product [Choristocarpus tenellus]
MATFSMGVDAVDPMVVEETLNLSLDAMIKNRKKNAKESRKAPNIKESLAKKRAANSKIGATLAKSVGGAKAKREAALAMKRGLSPSPKPKVLQVDREVQKFKAKILRKQARNEANQAIATAKGHEGKAKAKLKLKVRMAAIKKAEGKRSIQNPSSKKGTAGRAAGSASVRGRGSSATGRKGQAKGSGIKGGAEPGNQKKVKGQVRL